MDYVKHFHVMSSDPGCLPDSHEVYPDFQSATEAGYQAASTFYGDGDTRVVSEHIDYEREYADWGVSRHGTANGWITHVVEVYSCEESECITVDA